MPNNPNKKKIHRPVGKPPAWNTPELFEVAVKKYFKECDDNSRPYTIAGLAAHLEVDRQTIYNYSYKEDYFDIVKKARDKIIARLEEIAITKGNAGTIFVMKNYGYVDKQEIDNKLSGSISYESNLKELKGEKM